MRPFYNMPYMRTLQAEWAANAKAKAEKEKAEKLGRDAQGRLNSPKEQHYINSQEPEPEDEEE